VNFFVFSHGTISSKYHPELGLEIILVSMYWVFCRNAASFNKPINGDRKKRVALFQTLDFRQVSLLFLNVRKK